jgi:hypothetical protein
VAPVAPKASSQPPSEMGSPEWVIGPRGEKLTLASLPPTSTKWWNARRKAEVVAAVEGGLLTETQACERYQLSLEELAAWQCAIERSGWDGLRVTRLQYYRALWARRVQ